MKFKKLILDAKSKFSDHHLEESILFVCIGIISAIVCSLYAKLFSLAEETSVRLFQEFPLALFIASPLGLLLSYYLVKTFAPGASGSGIPQVMACIEREHHNLAKKLLRKSIILIKMGSSLLAVVCGAAIGREGPSLQISAAISYQLGLVFKKFKVNVKPEQVLVAGAASGLAAAFNTPIGGVVYAIEELSKEHVRNFKDVLLLAVVISGLTAQLILGNYLYLGYPTVPKSTGFQTLLAISLVSLLCGILGSLFSKSLTSLIRWRSKQTQRSQMVIIACIGIILASFFYFLGSHSLYSGKEVINQALFSQDAVDWPMALSRFFGPLLSSMTGIAGGIFAPSLSTGAAIGSFTAEFINPEMKTIFALAGMVSFLTGVTHTPITSFILVLEMTDRHSVVLPMMIAAVFSSIGARLISSRSFYEVALDGILEAEKENSLKTP